MKQFLQVIVVILVLIFSLPSCGKKEEAPRVETYVSAGEPAKVSGLLHPALARTSKGTSALPHLFGARFGLPGGHIFPNAMVEAPSIYVHQVSSFINDVLCFVVATYLDPRCLEKGIKVRVDCTC